MWASITGYENRSELDAQGLLDSVSVAFVDGMPNSYGIQRGQLVRGTGNEFTLYKMARSVCTESSSNYTIFSLGMASGTIEAGTGNMLDTLTLTVTIGTSGTLTTACATRLNGLTENEGEWTASETPLIERIDLSALEYMCEDGGNGYAPTETWSRTDGTACTCTTAYP